MDRAQGAAGDAKIKESLPLEFCLGVKEINNEGTHAPYIGNRPAGMDVHGPEDPSKDGGTWAGQGNGRAVFSKVLFGCSLAERVHQADKEIPGRRNSMSKGMGLSLRLQGAGYDRNTGHVWGRAGGTQGRQGQLVKSLTRHSCRGGTLSCRPQGVPEGFVE